MDFRLTRDEEVLRIRVREFAIAKLGPIASRVDSVDEYSPEVIVLLRDEGLFKYVAPKEYGGHGISSIASCIIREELARICTQADLSFIMSLFSGHAINEFGTKQQKDTFLRHLATGEVLGTTAITEPAAGSDISAIETNAISESDGYVLNGTKIFCSMAAAAEACVVIASTDKTLGVRGLTAFVVDCKGERQGLRTKIIQLMSPHPVYQIDFINYRVPKNCLLGEPGQGLKVVLSMLGRCRTTVGAAAVGMACSAYEETLGYVKSRIAFKRSLAEFQATQLKLADMVTSIEAARLITLRAAWGRDNEDGADTMTHACMAKLFATEAAQRVIDEAVQLHGGYGLVRGTRVEYLYRTIRALRIYEGTSEIQKLTIARHALENVT